MSTYYNIAGMKVRISDHLPNTALRGSSDIYFYTTDIDGRKLSIIDQIEYYCMKNDIEPTIFKKIADDFPDEIVEHFVPEFIEVKQEIVDKYNAITGKNSMKKKIKFCESIGIDEYKMSQQYYKIKVY